MGRRGQHGVARTAATVELVDTDDPRWDRLGYDAGLDPHGLRPYARIQAGSDGRAVLVHMEAPSWVSDEVVILSPLEGGKFSARSPVYGGPWLRTTTSGLAPPAATTRGLLDELLRDLGVVSQVTVFSPWAPSLASVGATWVAQPSRVVVLAALGEIERRWTELGSTRRSEVRRAEREGVISWEPFDLNVAVPFSGRYDVAMRERSAAPRWVHDRAYFETMAVDLDGSLHMCTVEMATGGASALFLSSGRLASYLYAVRWGAATGAAAAALWTGQLRLAAMDVQEVLLGGGTTDARDDPLLRFKRSLGDREVDLLVSGRIYDAEAVTAAVQGGFLRPPPDWSIDMTDRP